jgi:hypothetical protein
MPLPGPVIIAAADAGQPAAATRLAAQTTLFGRGTKGRASDQVAAQSGSGSQASPDGGFPA